MIARRGPRHKHNSQCAGDAERMALTLAAAPVAQSWRNTVGRTLEFSCCSHRRRAVCIIFRIHFRIESCECSVCVSRIRSSNADTFGNCTRLNIREWCCFWRQNSHMRREEGKAITLKNSFTAIATHTHSGVMQHAEQNKCQRCRPWWGTADRLPHSRFTLTLHVFGAKWPRQTY